MAFALLACIRFALDDAEFLLKRERHMFLRLVISKLRCLETFVLFTEMLGSNGSLKSFLVKIEDIVRRTADLIHPHRVQLDGTTLRDSMADFERGIASLLEEVDGWYVTMLNQESTRVSFCTTDHPILEIISSLLKSTVYSRHVIQRVNSTETVFITVEACKQKLLFMKNLIRFAAMRNVAEPSKDLLLHTQLFSLSAAYSFFKLFCSSNGYYHELSELVKKIEHVDSHFYADCTRTLTSSSIPDDVVVVDDDDVMKDFLDSLISNLWDLLRLSPCDVSGTDKQEAYEGLRLLRTVLKKQHLRMKIKEDFGDVVCGAGVLVCSLRACQLSEVELRLANFLLAIRSIRAQIKGLEDQPPLSEIIKKEDVSVSLPVVKEKEEEGEEETGGKEVMASQGGGAVVGFHDDQRRIVDQLLRGSKKLQIIAIVGMPGLGKTTLATRVYTNSTVMRHFPARAWSPVSQVVDKGKVLLDIMNQIDPSKCSETSSLEDVVVKLWRSLRQRRYLIFLDDVWETESWDALKASFPNDNVGSRIIITSRRHDVAPIDLMVGEKPYCLRHLSLEDSMKLLQVKLSDRISSDVGRNIAKICKGLPLIIVIVAGVLQTTDPDVWNEILDGLRNVSSTDVQCRNALELSYRHMPPHLMPCLLYLGVFKEDHEIPVRRLLRLWIAERFVEKDGAEGYLDDLIDRSLVLVAKKRSDGGIKTCRIHDLLRGFCIQKAREEDVFHSLKGYDELSAFSERRSQQRLCIHYEVQHVIESKLFCPRARSLIFNTDSQIAEDWRYDDFCWLGMASTMHIFKLLAVLDIEQIYSGWFPYELHHLVHLAFLAIRCRCQNIPSMIGEFCNLETFILQCQQKVPVSFPTNIWNLQKLQYLHIKSYLGFVNASGGGIFPVESLGVLPELERLSGAVFSLSEMGRVVRKLPNILKLKFLLKCAWDDCNNIVALDFLSRLDSLHILCETKSQIAEFVLPKQLTKLTLGNFSLSSSNLSTIGELPCLQVLKLLSTQLEDETWELSEGEFPNLRTLKLVRARIVRWFTDCDDQLGCFQKLVLDHCSYLEEMPSSLDDISTLEVIEVSHCPLRVVNLVMQIEKNRQELIGDSNVKIITSN